MLMLILFFIIATLFVMFVFSFGRTLYLLIKSPKQQKTPKPLKPYVEYMERHKKIDKELFIYFLKKENAYIQYRELVKKKGWIFGDPKFPFVYRDPKVWIDITLLGRHWDGNWLDLKRKWVNICEYAQD